MRKKSLIGILGLCVMMLFSACGGSSNVHTVKMAGKTYDLTRDFQEVVGELVKSDVLVADMITLHTYDEDGYYTHGSSTKQLMLNEESLPICFARQSPNNQLKTEIIQNIYYFREDYETVHGIQEASSKRDIEELNGFLKYRGAKNRGSDAYIGMYINDKPVDWKQYEDDLDAIFGALEENMTNFSEVRKEYFSDYQAIPSVCVMLQSVPVSDMGIATTSREELEEEYFDIELLIALASQDAAKELREGKINSYSLVWYSVEKKSTEAYYYIYTYEEDWDNKKFIPEK